jgi:hypothetical protein
VNAARAFITISVVEIFWVVTAWPNGGFRPDHRRKLAAVTRLEGRLAYAGALAAALGCAGSILFAAIIKFAALPAIETFGAFCVAIGPYSICLPAL